MPRTADDVLALPYVSEAINRGVISVANARVKYSLAHEKSYSWTDPEEWARCQTIAWLVIERDYPPSRMKTEVTVPRRTPSDHADVVVYRDDSCRQPYLVVENKAEGQTRRDRTQAIEQLFGNANSLRAEIGLYDELSESSLFDVANFESTERVANRKGNRNSIPKQYGDIPTYTYVSGSDTDISSVRASVLEAKIRRAHSTIWAGGRRDPLTAFDEWSKLLFAKVHDERYTETGKPRRFQVGTKETTAAVANRIHSLFELASRQDRTIFPEGTRLNLPDTKINDVVKALEDVSFVRTDIDSIGQAFEQFFGAVFRGELGQYFTMRQLARFTVGVLDITKDDYVLDPTAGSGGFLLEALLQTWHRVDHEFLGQPAAEIERVKYDFAFQHVFGIEIHEVLARICKINLLLHHDGHTNIEANRSCLDAVFANPRMQTLGRFSVVVGNPPFGDDVKEGDEDKLGTNRLSSFSIAGDKTQVDSEQVILERSIQFLEPGGRLGLVMPDGLLNNQGEPSNCPATRRLLARRGRILAIVSLPDYAFRKSGAQNKTSILFFQKFTTQEQRIFDRFYERALGSGQSDSAAIRTAIVESGLNYQVFLAEANWVGYLPTGSTSRQNELFRPSANDGLNEDQSGTILGEWRRFRSSPDDYSGSIMPDAMAILFDQMWSSHASNRLDPKYFLFQREASRAVPPGWKKVPMISVMRKRQELAMPQTEPDKRFKVLTISQTGDLRLREAGKGNNPPEWLGSYLADMPSTWYSAKEGDVVYSSIDLWKGCIAVVQPDFDGGLVTKEFPIYEVIEPNLDPAFLQCLLRSRYYQRAFRAITTGHSNRRRTQAPDFEALEITYPEERDEQRRLIAGIVEARANNRLSMEMLKQELTEFSNLIDGRGDEELPDVETEAASESDE